MSSLKFNTLVIILLLASQTLTKKIKAKSIDAELLLKKLHSIVAYYKWNRHVPYFSISTPFPPSMNDNGQYVKDFQAYTCFSNYAIQNDLGYFECAPNPNPPKTTLDKINMEIDRLYSFFKSNAPFTSLPSGELAEFYNCMSFKAEINWLGYSACVDDPKIPMKGTLEYAEYMTNKFVDYLKLNNVFIFAKNQGEIVTYDYECSSNNAEENHNGYLVCK